MLSKIFHFFYKEKFNFTLNKYNEITKLNNLYKIDNDTVNLLILLEDRRYLQHKGYDITGILRAISSIIFSRKIQGASTIEQQLIRVITGNYQKTIKRKIQEISLAYLLSKEKNKAEIARCYIYIAYYGSNLNGYKQSSKALFNNENTPTLFEKSSLIARLRYPEPSTNNSRILKKINNRAAYGVFLFNKMKEEEFNESL